MLALARRWAWRKAGVYALPPGPGRNVGRAISPAAWGLRHRKVSGTMQASSPTKRRARSCPVLQDISAAKRQCTPSSAPCGASTSPCRGGFIESLPPGRLPCKGLRSRAPPAADTARRSRCSGRRTQVCFSTRSAMRAPQTGNVGVSRLRGAAPGLANTLPGSADPPGGRERPPYNARHTGGEIGAADCRTHWHRGRGLAIGPAVRAGAGRSRTGGGACPQR